MRKLKLQMHMSLDNYVTLEQGGTTFIWDDEVIKFCVNNLQSVDTILLGRNTAGELIPFWDDVATNPNHSEFALGKRISETRKVVFSNTVAHHNWKNTTIINGELNDEIIKLKKLKGNDILVYGGASLASALIKNGLVDEFYFLLNPICFGKGLTIFKSIKNVLQLTLVKSMPFPCGTVLLCYKPK